VNAASEARKIQSAVFHIVNGCRDSLSSVLRGSTDVSRRLRAATMCTINGESNALGDVGRLDGNGRRRRRNVRMNGAASIRGSEAWGTPVVDVGRDMAGRASVRGVCRGSVSI
jgi:hypothetical protein